MLLQKIRGVFQSIRFKKTFFVSVILGFLSGSIFYGFTAFLFLAYSFIFNDWVDSEKDRLGHPERAIPSGKITEQIAFNASIFLLALGLLWTYLFVGDFFVGTAFIFLLSTIYSYYFKPQLPVAGTFVWTAAITILFLQGFSDDLYLYLGVFIVVYGYEMLLDLRDTGSDALYCKTSTVAMLLGGRTKNIAIFILLGGLAICLYRLLQ